MSQLHQCERMHASCVALTPNAGVLILGRSGRGKSALSLSLMALGATLVSDDQVILTADHEEGCVRAHAPETIKGLIEARGVGILNARVFDNCVIRCVVDMDKQVQERLPLPQKERLIGIEIPLFYRVDAPHFAPALIQVLKGGQSAECDPWTHQV